jgi:hypothetical protein
MGRPSHGSPRSPRLPGGYGVSQYSLSAPVKDHLRQRVGWKNIAVGTLRLVQHEGRLLHRDRPDHAQGEVHRAVVRERPGMGEGVFVGGPHVR